MSFKSESSFWVSYSDLMTSLFLIMVALFAVTSVILVKNYNDTKSKLKDIEAIENSIRSMKGNYFSYDSIHKRHQLKIEVRFDAGKDSIKSYYRNPLKTAGWVLMDTVRSIKNKYPRLNINFTIIIEGMADSSEYMVRHIDPNKWYDNYTLSYRRALSLLRFWNNENVQFPSYCDVQVSGSGTGGIRESVDSLNRRFLIQILPKVGDLKK
jgi:hypothetical protein